MSLMNSLRGRMGAAAFAVVALAPVAPKNDPVRVTRDDVQASNDKVAAAYGALVTMWNNEFRRIGDRFDAPQIARYTGAARTACGIVRGNNAEYCDESNAIYYDEVFVAG